jgi:hypothetical protein
MPLHGAVTMSMSCHSDTVTTVQDYRPGRSSGNVDASVDVAFMVTSQTPSDGDIYGTYSVRWVTFFGPADVIACFFEARLAIL